MDTIETKIYTAFIIASVVIGALFLYFAVKMIRNHRRHFDLLRTYYLNEIELLEGDRGRIARDLHDDLGPLVSVANLLIQNCKGADEEDREFLAKAEQSMNELTIRLGGIAKNLTPGILNDKGLQSAIEQFIDTCRTATNIRFLFSCDLNQEPVQQFALHIYRMVQELFHNALKHSKATMVELRIAEENGSIHLIYLDDGIGLSEDSFNEGSGIRNMRNRVTVLNGLMQVNQQNKKGTEIYFSLPIKQPYA
jgi:signal transduction histidine kinase